MEESDWVATGTRLLWTLRDNTGVLSGYPVVFRQGANRLFGDRVEFARDEGRIRVTSKRRVEASLQPSGGGRLSLPF